MTVDVILSLESRWWQKLVAVLQNPFSPFFKKKKNWVLGYPVRGLIYFTAFLADRWGHELGSGQWNMSEALCAVAHCAFRR